MTALVLAALALVGVLAVAAVLVRERVGAPLPAVDRLLLDRLRERFVITVTSGESFDGLLIEVDDRTVVMRDVSVLNSDGARVPVDGEVILRRDAVAYLQKP